MPWTESSATRFSKEADTPAKKAAWAKAANAVLQKYKNEGKAIKVANATVAKMKGDSEMDDRKRKRRGQSRDPQGRELETWEEIEEWDSSPLAVIVDAPSVSNLRMYDAVEIDASAKMMMTSDGYLKAMPRIARTGIQLYKGDECGRPDVDFVRVYRPEDSVFANDCDPQLHASTNNHRTSRQCSRQHELEKIRSR